MQRNRLHQLYQQALRWSDEKLYRYLLLHKSPTDGQQLALALALLCHRLPFQGKVSPVGEDPEAIAEYLVQSSKDASDDERAATVNLLCAIAREYIDEGLEIDSEPIQLLVRTAADICLRFEKQSLDLVSSLRDFESLLERSLGRDDLELISAVLTEEFEKTHRTDEIIVCTVIRAQAGSYSVMIWPGNFPAVLRTHGCLKIGEQISAFYVGVNEGRITLIPYLAEPGDRAHRQLGTVRESLGNAIYRIALDDGKEIIARISPTFRKNFQAAQIGDRVYVKPAQSG